MTITGSLTPKFENLEDRLLLSGDIIEWQVGPGGDFFGNTIQTAYPAQMDETGYVRIGGAMQTSTDVDVFKVQPTVTGLMEIAMWTYETPAKLDSVITVFNSQGDMIGYMNNHPRPHTERLNMMVVAGHTYYVQASGAKNTMGKYLLRMSTIPMHVPSPNTAPVLSAIPDQTVDVGAQLTFKLTATDPDGDQITYSATNLPPGATLAGDTFSWKPTLSQVGVYNVTFTASDGELTDSKTVKISVVDGNRAPVLSPIGNKEAVADKPLSFAISATDPDGDPLTYSAAGLPNGATFNASTRTFNWTPTTAQLGTHDVTFTVSDGKLAAKETVRITVSNVNEAPIISPIGDKVVNEGEKLSFPVTATSPNGDPLTYSATGLPTGATFNQTSGVSNQLTLEAWFKADNFNVSDARIISKSYSEVEQDHLWMISTFNDNGVMRLRFRVNAGGVTRTLIGGQINANQWIHVAGTYDGQTMRLYQNGAQVASRAASGVLATDDTLPAWVGNNYMDNRPFSGLIDEVKIWNRALLAGEIQDTHQQKANTVSTNGLLGYWSFDDETVTDQSGNGNDGLNVRAGWGLGISGTAAKFSGNDLAFVTLRTFDIKAATAGHVFNWTPTSSQSGTYAVTFNVSDGKSTTSEKVSITVNDANHAPVLAPIGNKSVTVNQALSFTISATDPDGDALTYSATGLPSGATFNASTRTFSWTPTAAGTFSNIKFNVTDGKNTVSETISITVNPVATAPTDSSITNRDIYKIDADGDGYGVASPLGADADPNDPTVRTYAEAIAKHGSIEKFVNHLGYFPDRIFWGLPSTALQPGDMVIFAGGTYTGDYVLTRRDLHGTAQKPIVFLAKPGERVYLQGNKNGITIERTSHLVFDGFTVDGSKATGGGIGIIMHWSQNITFRNIDAYKWTVGMQAAQDLKNILIENSVFRNQTSSHGVYLAARDLPNSDITLRNNLFYGNKNGMQHNGRVTNLVLDNNIFHSNWLAGVSWLQGVSNSAIRNNLIFNNGTQGIVMMLYDDSSPAIKAYSQTNNLIENNIIWVGAYSTGQYDPVHQQAITVVDNTAAKSLSQSIIVRNNILVTQQGETFRFSLAKFANASTIENNLIYRASGSGSILNVGGTIYNWAGFHNYSTNFRNNTFADPKFKDVSINYYLTPEKFDFNR